jgi:mycothiol synthase
MTFTSRAYHDQADLVRMADLVYAHPDCALHVADLAYRLCSWALNDPRNAALWADQSGRLAGWAAAQPPFAALDYVIRPDAVELEDAIVEWGKERWRQIADEHHQPAYFYVGARDEQTSRVARLQKHGFRRDDWALIHLERPFAEPVPAAPPPAGFIIRPLVGQSEVAAYTALHRAAFGTLNMTEDWRSRTLLGSTYTPELDLVALAPDQTLAAFCICWLCRLEGQTLGQVEPIGVHPAHQGKGLGRAILAEGLRRMAIHGAGVAHIEADSTNPVSQRLYQSMGFWPVYEARAWYMVMEPRSVG